LEPSNKELVFTVGLEGVMPNKAKDIEKLVLDTIKSTLNGGISQSKIDAALHQLEISQREISGGTMPYGLQLILGAMGGCIHDEDPISLLDIDENIEILKNQLKETGYIDSLINNSFITN
ncbi:MAG: Zn-dependent peptidase, partial [Gammaproteobacteria bacterium]